VLSPDESSLHERVLRCHVWALFCPSGPAALRHDMILLLSCTVQVHLMFSCVTKSTVCSLHLPPFELSTIPEMCCNQPREQYSTQPCFSVTHWGMLSEEYHHAGPYLDSATTKTITTSDTLSCVRFCHRVWLCQSQMVGASKSSLACLHIRQGQVSCPC
jgi:hypothetical protein